MFANSCKNSLRRIVTTAEKRPILNEQIRNFEEIPGPKPLPIIGNLWRYLPIIGDYDFEKIHLAYGKMYEQFGPIVKEKIFGDRTIVHVFDPHDMRIVYESAGHYPYRLSHRALAKYRLQRPHLYSGPGLFPSNGEEWSRFRRLFQKILLMPSTPENCSDALEDVTDDLVANIPVLLDNNNETDLQPLLFSWALECIGVITLNRRLGCLSANGNKEATSLVKAANDTHMAVAITENRPFSCLSYKKLEAAQNLLSSVVEKYLNQAIEECKNGKNSDSILNQMLQIENADKRDVFTMILDMFLAGIDTTAYTLSFGLYNLAMNKDVQFKLREELKDCLPTKNSRLTGSENGNSTPYLRSVILETLRVNPVSIGTGRILQSDVVLSGYHVPAQSMVILQHQIASSLKQHFANPHQFEPERWSRERRREIPPLVSSPFGYGGRMCIGKKLALKEMHLALAKLVRNFDISYHYDKIDSCNRLINVPDKPLRLQLQAIND